MPEPEPEPEPEPAPLAPTEEIVSMATATAGVSSFAQLAKTVKSNRPGITVEQLAEELMRPMLRQWLDENLPDMVERLVQREIERMARSAEDE
jgi:cell pole-organizing protein PopZ